MNASSLTQRITLQQRTPTRDNHGQVVGAWSDVATVWASVVPNYQRSASTEMEPEATGFAIVHIRIRPGVVAGMRFVWQGQAWDIVGQPLPVDRTWLRFDAQLQARSAARELAA